MTGGAVKRNVYSRQGDTSSSRGLISPRTPGPCGAAAARVSNKGRPQGRSMRTPPNAPIQKNVLLLGAGNAHLRFVKMLAMRPLPGVAVTLVSEAPVIPYSAMVPGHIGGDYRWDEITIDLVRLCRAAGVRFVAARAEGIDPARRKVSLAARPELSYDVLSLGLGSLPARPAGLRDGDASWPMRPLAGLLER